MAAGLRGDRFERPSRTPQSSALRPGGAPRLARALSSIVVPHRAVRRRAPPAAPARCSAACSRSKCSHGPGPELSRPWSARRWRACRRSRRSRARRHPIQHAGQAVVEIQVGHAQPVVRRLQSSGRLPLVGREVQQQLRRIAVAGDGDAVVGAQTGEQRRARRRYVRRAAGKRRAPSRPAPAPAPALPPRRNTRWVARRHRPAGENSRARAR